MTWFSTDVPPYFLLSPSFLDLESIPYLLVFVSEIFRIVTFFWGEISDPFSAFTYEDFAFWYTNSAIRISMFQFFINRNDCFIIFLAV